MKIKEYFDQYLDYLRARGMTKKTVREHQRILKGALSHSIQDYDVSNLKMNDAALVEQAGRIHGKYGSQRAVVVLRRLLSFIQNNGVVLPLDWRDIQIPRVPRPPVEYLTDEELDMLRNHLEQRVNTMAALRTRALIEVLLDTGLRIGEACLLKKKDINLAGKEAMIENIKTHQMQKIYFTDRSLEWLQKYWSARQDGLEWAFVSGRGHMLAVTAKQYLREITKDLNINKHIRHHIFRKTLCTKLLQNKVDIKSTQYIMRHNSERTTLRYYAAVNIEKCKEMHQLALEHTQNQAQLAV
ncbi:MAG TPA: tyrosine-type recombinase/integrase [Patescibacteria group bacterium]|nr:tyrosine-type recombinase/integrase [Patescibacteria group bacterium]